MSIAFLPGEGQSAIKISPDIPIISVHQIPTYEEVLQFAYQIYQQSKVQQQDLEMCESIIQQIKQDNDILSAENTVWHESFYELQDSHTNLENKCTTLETENQELRTKAMGKVLAQATEWVQDAASRDAENFVLKQQVGERDQTITELRNRLKQDASSSYNQLYRDENAQEQRITELEAENTELRNENRQLQTINKRMQANMDRLQGDVTRHEQEWDMFYALCENEDLESSEKLYMWQCRRYVLSLRNNITEPTHTCLEVMGSKIGMKRDAPRRIMRNLNERSTEPLFFIDSEKKIKENGELRTNVTIRLAAIMQNPADVRKVNGKEHGGKPNRKCPKDQSENLDQFRLQHCRDCDDIALYNLPGTRADADVIGAMNAVAKEAPIYKKLQEQLEEALKHLAPVCDCHSHKVGERDTEETAAIQLAKPEPALVAKTAQKQDASAELEQGEDNLQRNNTYRESSAASCKMINPATCQCCEGIDRGYAPIHRCYNCGASNYEWNHMRRRWLCGWCGATPAF